MIKLYFAPGSCSLVSQSSLEEAGADYSAISVKLSEGEQNGAAYRAVNPLGRVPALVVDDVVITETLAIASYVASRFPDARLLPEDVLQRARTWSVLAWFASSVQISFSQIFRPGRFTQDITAQEILKRDGRGIVMLAFDRIEALAGRGEWMMEDAYSLVDIYATAFWRWAPRLDINMTRYGAWNEHAARVLERPAVRRVLQLEEQALRPLLNADE